MAYDHQVNKVNTILAKLKNIEEDIDKVLKKKETASSPSEIQDVVDQFAKFNKEKQRLVEDYDKEVTILNFRFPEKGVQTERKYPRFKVKKEDDLEKSLGVDGKLDQVHFKLEQKYQSPKNLAEKDPEKKENEKRTPSSSNPIEEKPIILVK